MSEFQWIKDIKPSVMDRVNQALNDSRYYMMNNHDGFQTIMKKNTHYNYVTLRGKETNSYDSILKRVYDDVVWCRQRELDCLGEYEELYDMLKRYKW